jgi:hypothetical protein
MQRLERCKRDLSDPAHMARHVGDNAFSWGFNDLTHFSRIFKQRLGASPREWREHPTPESAFRSGLLAVTLAPTLRAVTRPNRPPWAATPPVKTSFRSATNKRSGVLWL